MNDFVIDEDFLVAGELTELEQERILSRVMEQAGLKQPAARRGLSRKRTWTLALVAVMTLAFAGMAVAQFSLDRDFLGFFNASEQQAGALQQAGQEVMRQASDNGATLTVEQVVGDRRSLYVLLDFAAPAGTVLDADTYNWREAWLDLSESSSAGYYFENLPDDDPTDNHIRMLLCLNTESSLSGQQLSLNLGDLQGYYPEIMDYQVTTEGNWQISFTLDYTPSFRVIGQEAAIQLGSATAHVTELEISPISLAVTAQIDNPEGFAPPAGYVEPQGGSVAFDEGGSVAFDEGGSELAAGSFEIPVAERMSDFMGDLASLTVTLKDGSILETRSGGGHTDDSTAQMIFTFDRILDIEDIASVVYCGQELKLQ